MLPIAITKLISNCRTGVEELTLARFMKFGIGQVVEEEFLNVFMDYCNKTEITVDVFWNDGITYDGTWENKLLNFFSKVTPKLIEDILRGNNSKLRNSRMQAMLRMVGFGDNAGSGLPAILA